MAATMQHGQSCSASITIPFTQKYSNKVCSNKYFKQVHVIKSRIPEVVFFILVYSEVGSASSSGCVSGTQEHTIPLRRGCFSDALDTCHLFNHNLFLIFGGIKSTQSWTPGLKHATFERVRCLSATAYYVKGISVALQAGFYQHNFTAQLSKIPHHLTWAETDGAGLIPS